MTYFIPRLDTSGNAPLLVAPLTVLGQDLYDLPHDRQRAHERALVTVTKKDKLDHPKIGSNAFLFSALMVMPWIVRNMLRFRTEAALVALVARIISGTAKDRRDARRALGLTTEPKKALRRDEMDTADVPDAGDTDDDRRDAAGFDSKPSSGDTLITVMAPMALRAHTGWQTLSVAFVKRAHQVGRLGLRAINAIVHPKPIMSVPQPMRPELDAAI